MASKVPKSISGFNELSDEQLVAFYTKLKNSQEFRDEFQKDIEQLKASVQKLWGTMDTMSQKDREEVTALARIVAYGLKVIEDTKSTSA